MWDARAGIATAKPGRRLTGPARPLDMTNSIFPYRHPLARRVAVLLAATTLAALGTRSAAAGGFAEPIAVLPEVGLYADGFTELGYGRAPGLVILWGIDSLAATGSGAARNFDWTKVPYRVRVELFNAKGKRVEKEELIVDPPRLEDGIARGGFPTTVRMLLRKGGVYRARLEAYPLIDPAAAGLDSVPRRVVEVEAELDIYEPTGGGEWRASDLLIVRQLLPWRPGSAPERTWNEWVLNPAVSRRVETDSAGCYLAFEVQRDRVTVPQCQRTNCRVAITVYSADGGVALQVVRPVPDPFSVSAYIVPLQTASLDEGEYEARVEVFEADKTLAAQARRFWVRRAPAVSPPPGTTSP